MELGKGQWVLWVCWEMLSVLREDGRGRRVSVDARQTGVVSGYINFVSLYPSDTGPAGSCKDRKAIRV